MDLKCPECGSRVKAPDEQAGQQITCPYCTTVVRTPLNMAASQQEELLEPEPVGAAEPALGGNSASSDDRRPCPMCGEFIPPQALKCRFCGEIFDPELKKAQKPESGPDDDLTPGDWLFGILCGGIACIFGVVWAIQGKKKGGKMILLSLASQIVLSVIRAAAETGTGRR
jgi:ribosomal protein S27E